MRRSALLSLLLLAAAVPARAASLTEGMRVLGKVDGQWACGTLGPVHRTMAMVNFDLHAKIRQYGGSPRKLEDIVPAVECHQPSGVCKGRFVLMNGSNTRSIVDEVFANGQARVRATAQAYVFRHVNELIPQN